MFHSERDPVRLCDLSTMDHTNHERIIAVHSKLLALYRMYFHGIYREATRVFFVLACLHRNFISNRENPQSLKHVSKFRLVCSEMKRTQCVIILYENQQQHNITTHTPVCRSRRPGRVLNRVLNRVPSPVSSAVSDEGQCSG